ncbi:hypothetical protein PPL_04194 [Heterostelium album PN500]|uniref:Uncharacterized protein n=1 Tax=Heterostelium pallidum (strain ATCC 26659 / Pp 5 / PN500) TaxID=670386 RepID=D3B6W3_HETP5|nr:hypothetical protein PPL_04194 [Heterostelium album PN500]EFA82506.1 hypothetical protein PPL_04194 [Heterostelium album PN500]|eukprot:XP_020434623.1 hypothetical protein PPL_04194 [Heterostelium album PN500]
MVSSKDVKMTRGGKANSFKPNVKTRMESTQDQDEIMTENPKAVENTAIEAPVDQVLETTSLENGVPPKQNDDLVSMRIYIYFVAKVNPDGPLRERPSLYVNDNRVESSFQDSALFAIVRAPTKKEFKFLIKVGDVPEKYVTAYYRTILADHAHDNMLYLGACNQTFDGRIYHDTAPINSIAPYVDIVKFLANNLSFSRFEDETTKLFDKLRTFRNSGRHEMNTRTTIELLELDSGVPQENILPIVIILFKLEKDRYQSLFKIDHLEVGIDLIKKAFPVFKSNPGLIDLAKKYNLVTKKSKTIWRFFNLVSAFVYSFNKQSTMDAIVNYRSSLNGQFSKDESEFINGIQDWSQYSSLDPSMFINTIAMAISMSQQEILPLFFTEKAVSYKDCLMSMKKDEYLQEWKFCLETCPDVKDDNIPFTFHSVKFKEAERQ